jgi:hypothetical protein
MERQSALVLTIIFFMVFAILAYYGAQVTLWSSIIFSVFVSLILLNLFYPISQATADDPDYSLVIYAIFEVVGIFVLALYIAQRTLNDVREGPEVICESAPPSVGGGMPPVDLCGNAPRVKCTGIPPLDLCTQGA